MRTVSFTVGRVTNLKLAVVLGYSQVKMRMKYTLDSGKKTIIMVKEN